MSIFSSPCGWLALDGGMLRTPRERAPGHLGLVRTLVTTRQTEASADRSPVSRCSTSYYRNAPGGIRAVAKRRPARIAKRPELYPQPPDPQADRKKPQIRQNVVLTRCLGCPRSYMKWGNTAANGTFLPRFLPHPGVRGTLRDRTDGLGVITGPSERDSGTRSRPLRTRRP